MAFYFHDNAKRARARPITTLPMTLNNDLKILRNRSISLTSQKDLETLRKIAERRQERITFIADIKKAAEAARSDDNPSGILKSSKKISSVYMPKNCSCVSSLLSRSFASVQHSLLGRRMDHI